MRDSAGDEPIAAGTGAEASEVPQNVYSNVYATRTYFLSFSFIVLYLIEDNL